MDRWTDVTGGKFTVSGFPGFWYKKYIKLIPHIGKIVVGEKEPYDYLIESIENFINQDELIELMQKNYFIKCEYRNLSGGMVAIHSGWKI